MVLPEVNVRLCVAGVVYPVTFPQVIVYVPIGFEGEDCEVPEPEIVAGPVTTQDDGIFEDTETVPVGATHLFCTTFHLDPSAQFVATEAEASTVVSFLACIVYELPPVMANGTFVPDAEVEYVLPHPVTGTIKILGIDAPIIFHVVLTTQ